MNPVAQEPAMNPDVSAYFDEVTNTISYIVADPATRAAAIVDSVLDYDPKSGRTASASADRLIAAVHERALAVEWILETHVHADHLSAAPYLKARLGGRIGIGEHIRQVQKVFKTLFNAESGFDTDGRQFDHLFADGERFRIGGLEAEVLHTPGHTPADITYVIGDAAFIGDTLFMPDYGTARADFPGGDAHALYRSVRRILTLPPRTRLFTGHDYAPGGRSHAWESTVAEQRARNVHVHDGITEDEFVAMRTARDATLDMPRLILPSVQVNMRAGNLPPPEDNGVRYLKIPIDRL
jgi:glyoxylase-like metal-dependent hydrolase (beta-lactamase superfamily II)